MRRPHHPVHGLWREADTTLRMAILLIILLVGMGVFTTVQVVNATSGLRTTQETLAAQQQSISTNQAHITALALDNSQRVTTLAIQRKATVKLICHTTNEVVRNLRALIVGGVKSGRIFNKLFQQFHAPPFQARLRMAEAQARSIQPVDCPSLR